MTFSHRIASLRDSQGSTFSFPKSGVICVVGGNNAGKSQLLRDIYASIDENSARPVTFSDLQVTQTKGTIDDAAAWLEEHGERLRNEPGYGPSYVPRHSRFGTNGMEANQNFVMWFKGTPYLGNAARFFVDHIPAGSLSQFASGSIASDSSYGALNTPLTAIYADGELEQQLSDLSQQTFGLPLTLDRVGVSIRLAIGEVDVPIPPINRPTHEYAAAVQALPLFDHQGDGVKSFIGLALKVMTRSTEILLVDEPEAFLHPGQARALGRWIGQAASELDLQIFVATHDRDFVLGLLEADNTPALSVLRITREDGGSAMAQLPPDEVRAVWEDPVLRYSNVLQGLFHRKVFVCESDGDCRFYGAAFDQLAIESDQRAVSDDTLFVPSGSKNRIGALLRALSSLRVEAAAIVDFDIFKSKADLKGIVTATGGIWSAEMDVCYNTLLQPINAAKAQGNDRWPELKQSGMAAVAPGSPYRAAQDLLGLLANTHVHVVPVGEMEGFDRASNLHGAAWVSSALENGSHTSKAVTDFVIPMLASTPHLSDEVEISRNDGGA
ncbi:ATP-dependent endonuclease [Herbiconiux sp. UC225_62]|uniref:ATP-dependent nuclease n=1 Tax=Herbiconiux sp. UC225_62 TaxID=3350168 RepID=UPI0036D28F79